MSQIVDGGGTGYRAKVNENQRVYVQAVEELIESYAKTTDDDIHMTITGYYIPKLS